MRKMAGAKGFEPLQTFLENVMLAVKHQTPIWQRRIVPTDYLTGQSRSCRPLHHTAMSLPFHMPLCSGFPSSTGEVSGSSH